MSWNFTAATELGGGSILVVIGVITLSITVGLVFGRIFPLPKRLSLLLGIGNGVCGSAAIAAAAPLMEAKQEEIGISIGIVNLLGAVAIFLLPFLARILDLDSTQSGLLVGGTVQAVGQTLATGLRMGEEVARTAIVIKMGRVLLLGVVLIALSIAFRSEKSGGFPVPTFIVAFLVCTLAVNILPLPRYFLSLVESLKTALLLCAMAAIGMSIEFSSLSSSRCPGPERGGWNIRHKYCPGSGARIDSINIRLSILKPPVMGSRGRPRYLQVTRTVREVLLHEHTPGPLFSGLPFTSFITASLSAESVMSLEEALETARENSLSLYTAEKNLDSAHRNYANRGNAFYPSIRASSSLNRSNSESSASGLIPVSPGGQRDLRSGHAVRTRDLSGQSERRDFRPA